MTDNHIDVLINGCGIGGAMLAYLLGRQGHRVVVVEQARRERAINGADLLKPAGIRVVEAAGLLAEVTRRGGRVRHELEVYHDGELLRYFNYSSVDARGYFILMPCESLRRLVLEKIDGEATVEMLFETRIEAVQRDERHAIDQVRLNDGRVLRPRVVVGADGIASYVRRRLLDIDVERRPYPSPMLVGTFALAPCVAERNRLYVDSQGGLAYFYPIGFDRARLVVSFPREEARELMADTRGESLRRRLQRFVGDESAEAIAAVTGTSRFKGIPIGYLNLDRYWADNVAMLGDAIHNVHPITGQGMNLAIEDASALADALDLALRDACALEDALAGYQAERFPVNQAIVSYGHALATSLEDRQRFAGVFDTALQGSSRAPEALGGERS
ncbi:FAD-dependent monooxygenase PqsL, partial [Pseudomonas aeruginosa]